MAHEERKHRKGTMCWTMFLDWQKWERTVHRLAGMIIQAAKYYSQPLSEWTCSEQQHPTITQTRREGAVAQLPKMPLHFKLRMAIPPPAPAAHRRDGPQSLPFNLGPFCQPQLYEGDFLSLPLRDLGSEDSLIAARVMCPVHPASHPFSANGL